MVEKVVMPHLGESVTEGTISKWLVQVGDEVKKYDPLCEVSTDKVVAEVPSMSDGTISEIVVREGETVAVLSLICYIATEGEAVSTPAGPSKAATTAASPPTGAKQRFSPAVLKLAQEHNLDLSGIQGTGAGGRITRDDIFGIIEGNGLSEAAPAFQGAAPRPEESERELSRQAQAVVQQYNQDVQVIPVSAVRRTIASRMVQSKHEAPHAWMMIQCDVTNLVLYRSGVKDEFKKKEGLNLTYMPFFIKAVVEAIKGFPIMNSQWDGSGIIVKKAIHISIAVATDDALFVPVIKDADQKSILGLAKAVSHLANKSKDGKLTMDDLADGTFTINNTGAFGSVLSAPIINPPQAAILSMEAIVKQPVVIGNMIAIRDMMNICLSLDHRVLDGLVCGRFLQSVKQKIESYSEDTQLY
jgi:2-oxoisovalerate dehydrogenase E2 component (dihydrolipoyl transacylase)